MSFFRVLPLSLGFVVLSLVLTGCSAGRSDQAIEQEVTASTESATLAESHIEANAPADVDFEKFLDRDLTNFFVAKLGKAVEVDHSYLRIGATQTGISYPKYYLWVKVSQKGKVITEGAVRVAAMDAREFEVTDYLSKVDIQKDKTKIYEVFPVPVCTEIEKQIGKS